MSGSIVVSPQTIITAAAVLAAIIAIFKYYNKIYDLVKHQKEQDESVKAIERRHDTDIKGIKEEQTLITYGVLACLKGLQEQGCNGAVTDAIDKIDKYLNQAAHGQKN